VNFLCKKKVKLTTAYFLLALLIFINAIKAFHQHGYSCSTQNKSISKHASAIHLNASCSICAFQIAKDIDATTATPQVSTPGHCTVSYFTFSTLILHNFSITSSVRGPPVLLS